MDACRGFGSEDLPDSRVLAGRQAHAELESVVGYVDAAVAADDGRRVVALVAKDGGRVHLEHPRTLLRHGREHTLGACLGRNMGRDAPERALLLRQPPDLGQLRFRVAFESTFVGAARCACAQVDARGDQQRRAAIFARHQPVRPRDQLALSVLRQPVTDLRA